MSSASGRRRKLFTLIQHEPKGRRHGPGSFVRKPRSQASEEELGNSIKQAILNTQGDYDVALDMLEEMRERQSEKDVRIADLEAAVAQMRGA